MEASWKVLVEAGLPEGVVRKPPAWPLDDARLRSALGAVASRFEEVSPERRELLLAWLRAWKHHWPVRFGSLLGASGERCLSLLPEQPADPNRYLKMRRIAIENLAHVL